jgi:hypothetical protein
MRGTGASVSDVARHRAAGRGPERPLSLFEFWPSWLFYAPIAMQWLALGLRYGSLGLHTAANPRITTGGLCGESKSAILDQVDQAALSWIAPYTTIAAEGPAGMPAAEAALRAAGLEFPIVAKPDIGCNGTGVRLLSGPADLRRYLTDFPAGPRIMLQAFVPHEGEAGLFYIRHPDEPRGRITSLTLKDSPVVVGDGRSTLRGLILRDPRAGLVPHLYLPRLAARLDEVPASGARVRLVFVGNHCKGATFRNGADEVTPELTDTIERIARAIPDFHFGRFDVRFRSVAELRLGTGFSVIEVNGVGSEATHIWDPRTTLLAAYAAQFAHYRAAFEIGRRNRAAGHRPSGVWDLFRAWRQQRTLMASYPMND